MMSPAIIRNAPPHQDLMNELNIFLKGALNAEKCSLELTKSALKLVKNLPAVRTAVFEYLCNVFIEISSNYIQGIEREINTGEVPTILETDEAVLSEIYLVFVNFINDHPTAWAPILSTWSLELLGEISSKFAGRAHISSNLNESLQLWMNSVATKILVDINTKCLMSLIHSDTESCINALLDTSIKHSPNFDWVVAHVGSCFPNMVITRVLSCGLKDFCQNKSYEQSGNSAKLKSIVGILGHLASSHSSDIQSAVFEMFTWSIEKNCQGDDAIKLQKKSTIPFILHLSLLSSSFLSSICSNIKQILSVDVIVKLCQYVDDWCKYFGSTEVLEDILITLILKCDTGGIQIINFLLDCVVIVNDSDINKQLIKEKSLELLQNILQKLNELTRQNKSANLTKSLSKEIEDLYQNLVSSQEIKSQITARIIIYLSHDNPTILISSTGNLFKNAQTPQQLSLLIKMLTDELIDKSVWPNFEKDCYFSIVIEEVLSKDISKAGKTTNFTQMWKNLLVLLRWEKTGRVPSLKSQIISRSIYANLAHLAALFGTETDNVHIIADILDLIEISAHSKLYNPPIQVILNLTQSTVNYFFICCKENGTSQRVQGFAKCGGILKRLCAISRVAMVFALRELLERALFRKDNVLFGSKSNKLLSDTNNKLLWKQNKKINKTIPLTKHSSVFNGGIIGNGKKRLTTSNDLPQDDILNNTTELIEIIKCCCSLENVSLVSLLLVQFVSPDVMYNGLPWPDEEFSKVTIERDLFIRRLFSNCPVLWHLLNFVAVYRPALCYCSVLLRALVATLIHQWKSVGEQSNRIGKNYESLTKTTVMVINVMAMGQLLPPPLSSISDVLPHLKCLEIVAILRECIWCYMRDHIPSPALFTCEGVGVHWRDPTVSRPPEIYTNTLRIIMQKNINNVGDMYAQMFINVPNHD